MIVKIPGYVYELENLHNKKISQIIYFIHKENNNVSNFGELSLMSDGTSNEEVLMMLIDRMSYLNATLHSKLNDEVIMHLKNAYNSLVQRTKERTEKGIEGTSLSE